MQIQKRTFLNIPFWRWILLFFLFSGISICSYYYLEYCSNTTPLLFDGMLYQTNDILMICFMLSLPWFLIIGDINKCFTFKNISIFKKIFRLFVYVLIVNISVLLILLISDVFIYTIGYGIPFVNNTNYSLSTILCSFLFFYLRFNFFSLLIYYINVSTKTQYGFLCTLTIGVIDWLFYEFFNFKYPLGILPIEHTRVFYTEAMAPQPVGSVRISYGISLIYWCILIIVLFILIYCNIKKSVKEEIRNER